MQQPACALGSSRSQRWVICHRFLPCLHSEMFLLASLAQSLWLLSSDRQVVMNFYPSSCSLYHLIAAFSNLIFFAACSASHLFFLIFFPSRARSAHASLFISLCLLCTLCSWPGKKSVFCQFLSNYWQRFGDTRRNHADALKFYVEKRQTLWNFMCVTNIF